jgi:hypothetical protein
MLMQNFNRVLRGSGRIINPLGPYTSSRTFTEANCSLTTNLRSPERRLIELRIEHGDLDALIDRVSHEVPVDELMMRRLKKQRLGLRDAIAQLERTLSPKDPA